MTDDAPPADRTCAQCQGLLVRRDREPDTRWMKRTFCSNACAMADRKAQHSRLMGSIRLRREHPFRWRPYE